MEQLDRIKAMEEKMTRAEAVIRALKRSLEAYRDALPELRALEEYLSSDTWRADFAAEERGLFPPELKRGVLSEDGLFNLLEEHTELVRELGWKAAESEPRTLKKPKHLERGDKVAIVSLSRGMLGEPQYLHKYRLARERLERDFGLEVVAMPNALRGIEYLDAHPEARAQDLMDAFRDRSVKAVFNAIGGDDTIRLLPYVDFDVLRGNPKIFTGFSDTTTNHFMLRKAGVISYYGASVMGQFSEYGRINDYTLEMIRRTLFEPQPTLEIPSAPYWYDDEDEKIWWDEKNLNVRKPYHPEEIGYELLQGGGVAEGELFGGCIDVFPELLGTALWPSPEEWRGKLLFLETSEDDMPADYLKWYLRGMAAQGIFDRISGILVGKPARRSKYEPYKEVYRRVVGLEAGHPELPILYNLNFGHAEPIGVIPLGVRARLDAERKTLTLLEPATE